MRISDWSSDVCSSDLYACRSGSRGNYSWTTPTCSEGQLSTDQQYCTVTTNGYSDTLADVAMKYWQTDLRGATDNEVPTSTADPAFWQHMTTFTLGLGFEPLYADQETPIPMDDVFNRSEEHTSELKSLMRISYAVCCWKT